MTTSEVLDFGWDVGVCAAVVVVPVAKMAARRCRLPKSAQPAAKGALGEIWNAEGKEHAAAVAK